MEKFGYSITGPRKNNEDSYVIIQKNEVDFCCVADGVGGSACGEFASKFAIERFISQMTGFANNNLKELLLNVNRDLINEADRRSECKHMATTFTGLSLTETYAQFVHIGDTRLYLLRGNGLKQLTKDHTEVQRLLDEGLISREVAVNYARKNVLESALGMQGQLKIDYHTVIFQKGDRFIIASDGFYGVTSKNLLRDLSIANKSFKAFCTVLKSHSDKSALIDNCTFVVVQV